jgi:hypothetical protein
MHLRLYLVDIWNLVTKNMQVFSPYRPNMFSLDLSGAKKSSPPKSTSSKHLKPTKAKDNDWCFKPKIAPCTATAQHSQSHPFLDVAWLTAAPVPYDPPEGEVDARCCAARILGRDPMR